MSICKPTFVPKWRILNITELVLMIDNPAKNLRAIVLNISH